MATKLKSEFYKIQRSGPVPSNAIYHGLLGDITRAMHPHTEGDPVGVLASLLAMTSAAVGASPHVKLGNKKHPLLFWPVLSGRTSLGRKGTATSAAMEIFGLACSLMDGGDDEANFLARNLMQGVPASGAAIVSTGEEMALDAEWFDDDEATLLGGFPILCIEEEWGAVMKTSARDKDMGRYLRLAWQGDTLVSMTKKVQDRARLLKSHIAVIGHVTPDEFKACLNAADVAGGSWNRLFVLYVERCQSLPLAEDMPDAVADALAIRLRDAILFGQGVKYIKLGDDARNYWKSEMYERLMQLSTKSLLIEAFAGRALPYVMRLAGLYALMDKQRVISKAHLIAAEALVEYMIMSVQHIMEGKSNGLDKVKEVEVKGNAANAQKHIQARIKALLMAAGPDGMTSSELLAVRALGGAESIQDNIVAMNGDVKRFKTTATEGLRGAPPMRYVWVGSKEEATEEAQERREGATAPVPEREPVSAPAPVPEAVSEPPRATRKPAPAKPVAKPAVKAQPVARQPVRQPARRPVTGGNNWSV